MSRTVDLSDETARLLDAFLEGGRTADSVLRCGLEALAEKEARRREHDRLMAELRQMVEDGENSGIAPDGTLDRARHLIRQKAAERHSAEPA